MKTIHCALVILYVCCISLGAVPTPTTPKPVSQKDACNFWSQFTQQMNDIHKTNPFLSYDCKYNTKLCDGADCVGAIKYMTLDIRFCFGMKVNHCDHPISMDIYYISRNSSFSERIHHNDSKELSGMSMETALGRATPFVFFNLTRPVPHHVLFGIEVKVRVTAKLFDIEEWPSNFQQVIIPNTEIPVTSCSASHVTAPLIKDHTCNKMPDTTTSTGTHLSTTMKTPSVTIKSVTYNKSCDMTTLDNCGVGEICKESTKEENVGRCLCKIGDINPITGQCDSQGDPTPGIHFVFSTLAPTGALPIHNQPQTGKQSSKTSNAALIGGIVAGVVIVAIVAVVAFVLFRRHRNNQQYIGRILLDNDDNAI